jgi:hypothetical protein
VGAPRNHFEPAFVSIVEHERSVMTLVSPSHSSPKWKPCSDLEKNGHSLSRH